MRIGFPFIFLLICSFRIPDLILLDVMMPRMDGIATLKALQLLPNLAHIPIIFLTAKAQKYEVEDYFKLGIADVIVKPFDPNTLGSAIVRIWETWIQNH
jgi:CheY-like chemotaxis protein